MELGRESREAPLKREIAQKDRSSAVIIGAKGEIRNICCRGRKLNFPENLRNFARESGYPQQKGGCVERMCGWMYRQTRRRKWSAHWISTVCSVCVCRSTSHIQVVMMTTVGMCRWISNRSKQE
ncbi:hypothetical protein AVEN_178816-1 [Araneus ventricosus]|uniref:Uncharacterized protein n=1 Tax=Araneus ventricosus TaxID=182803 RepID=A0A4Y2BDI8_ARAVE|nr:hypothetical protein AVEN_178816-1 [Araneus ventricosus]